MEKIEQYEEKELVLCEVKEIVRTTVFVETLEGVKGSILFSEIAPGRIRNIRVYVVPKKIIVCKILKIQDNHLFLSLRRVKEKERKELLERYKKEKSWKGILKKLLGERAEEVIEKIGDSLTEFFEEARFNLEKLEEHFNKEQITHLTKVLAEKKQKQKQVKKQFKLSSKESDGIVRVKNILSAYDNITYLGNSQFQITIISTDLKKAGSELNQILETIEKQAKKQKCEFELKK